MLDSTTKKRIDDLRDILVGKIPNPQGQVEQITIGLIYKFMSDYDKESVEMGGDPSYFVGKFKKYAWDNLFDATLGGEGKVKLYRGAVEAMYNNPNVPSFYRDVFKNATLPFNDPAILNMFLKEINKFSHSESESLGDAYEYLLSFMGSQGDLGQFRTPSHIIDFIVGIVKPQKDETILDPACGTSGFLISAFKYMKRTHEELGKELSLSELEIIGENLFGYDIDPVFTRVGMVNMYLHDFDNPNIYEYDTLSSEDKWEEYFDVSLANPPFFSPKGGIKPHSRFEVQSKKAAVLFVDYIMDHLNSNGRAGIIVPEGILFRTERDHKALREKLVKKFLVGVISLPAGVFNPYSGIKTSILILDKKLHSLTDNIFFAKVENDGYDLGAKREKNDDDDLPDVINEYQKFYDDPNNYEGAINRKEIIESEYHSFNFAKYQQGEIISDFDVVKLSCYVKFEKGKTITEKETVQGDIPVIAGGQKPAYYHNISNRDKNSITVSSSGAYAGFIAFHPYPIFASDCFTIEPTSKKLNKKFIFYLLKSKQKDIYKMQSVSGQPHVYSRDFDNFEIPLPPIKIQEKIVEELDNCQEIISGCKQIIGNYKPSVDIDSSWEMVELGEACNFVNGAAFKPSDWNSENEGGVRIVRIQNLNDKNAPFNFTKKKVADKFHIDSGDLLFSWSASFEAYIWQRGKALLNQHIFRVEFDENEILKMYLFCALNKIIDEVKNNLHGIGIFHITKTNLEKIEIPIPPIDVQEKIVAELEEQEKIIEGNKKLIEIHEKKMQNVISKLWREE